MRNAFQIARTIAVLILAALIPWAAAEGARQKGTGGMPVGIALDPCVLEAIAQLESIHETLFSRPFSVDQPAYSLAGPLDSPGQYQGATASGESFALTAVMAEPVDLLDPTLPLSEQERAWVIASGFTATGTLGVMTTPLASLAVSGLAITTGSGDIDGGSYFLVCGLLDLGSPLFQSGVEHPKPTPVTCVFYPIYCIDGDCVDQCDEVYEQSLADALAEYDEAVEKAQREFDSETTDQKYALDIALWVASSNLATAVSAAAATTAVATLFCVFAGPFVVPCVAAAVLTGGIIYAAGQANYDTAVQAANALYAQQTAPAAARRSKKLNAAALELDRAIAEAEDALRECLGPCKYFCGWGLECFY